MSKPRRDVILRRFMAGMSVFSVAYRYDLTSLDVEQIIRDALNGKTRIP